MYGQWMSNLASRLLEYLSRNAIVFLPTDLPLVVFLRPLFQKSLIHVTISLSGITVDTEEGHLRPSRPRTSTKDVLKGPACSK